MSEPTKFKGKQHRQWYLMGHRDAITEAIERLEKIKYVKGTKELEIYTVNPIILELKSLRGDFD